jgi:tetratricopeptide (TPR) repeat protein
LRENELEEARRRYEAALPLYDRIEARVGQANTLKGLGDLALRENELKEARRQYEAALALFETIEARLGKANTLHSLGDLAHQEGDHEEAVGFYVRSIQLAEAIQDGYTRASAQNSMIPALMALGKHKEALATALDALGYFVKVDLAHDVRIVANKIYGIKSQIGMEAFHALWQEVVGQPQPGWLQGE